MPFYEREKELLTAIEKSEYVSINTLLKSQYTSISTLRRDLIKLEEKGLIIRTHGGVMAVKKSPDDKIAFFLREGEQSDEKKVIANKAAELVCDGDTVMLDASTSAYCIIPYLAEKCKEIIVITSGSKASYLLGELGINNICTGGKMITKSFSYVGQTAEETVLRYNADIAFFSCRGLSESGYLTDNSVEENDLRRTMIKQSKRNFLLCNSDKLGHTCLNNLCHISEIDGIISETDVPQDILNMLKK